MITITMMIYQKHSTFSFSPFCVLCLFLMHHFQDKPPTAARSSIFHCLITRQSCQPQGLRNNRFVIIPPPNLGPKSSGNLVTWLNTMCTFWHFTHFILSVHCFLKLNCRTIIYSVHTGVVTCVNIHTVKSVNKSVWSPKDRDKGQACINLLPASSTQTNIIYLTTTFLSFFDEIEIQPFIHFKNHFILTLGWCLTQQHTECDLRARLVCALPRPRQADKQQVKPGGSYTPHCIASHIMIMMVCVALCFVLHWIGLLCCYALQMPWAFIIGEDGEVLSWKEENKRMVFLLFHKIYCINSKQ